MSAGRLPWSRLRDSRQSAGEGDLTIVRSLEVQLKCKLQDAGCVSHRGN